MTSDELKETCRPLIVALPEYADFAAAAAGLAAGNASTRLAAWRAVYADSESGTPSPAYALRVAIREVVNGQADSTVSPLVRESAYQDLAGFFCCLTGGEPPPSAAAVEAEEIKLLTRLQLEESNSHGPRV